MATRAITLFETPIYTLALPRGGPLNRDLGEAIRQRQGAVAGVAKSNIGGWQSTDDMLGWGGPAAAALAGEVARLADTIVSDPVGGPAAVRWQPEMWANVNRTGESNQSHWHPGSFLSFVYYVDDGRTHAQEDVGGELVFVDPRMPQLRMRTPDLRHRNAAGDVDEHETWVRPATGLLIGFPSFVAHSVRPFRGAGTRVSIAINLVARDPAR